MCPYYVSFPYLQSVRVLNFERFVLEMNKVSPPHTHLYPPPPLVSSLSHARLHARACSLSLPPPFLSLSLSLFVAYTRTRSRSRFLLGTHNRKHTHYECCCTHSMNTAELH